MTRRSIPGILLVSIVCFFLTFISVSCNKRQLIGLNGFQLVTGTTLSAPDMVSNGAAERIPPEPTVGVAFLCGIAALGLSLIPGRKAVLAPALLSAISLVA